MSFFEQEKLLQERNRPQAVYFPFGSHCYCFHKQSINILNIYKHYKTQTLDWFADILQRVKTQQRDISGCNSHSSMTKSEYICILIPTGQERALLKTNILILRGIKGQEITQFFLEQIASSEKVSYDWKILRVAMLSFDPMIRAFIGWNIFAFDVGRTLPYTDLSRDFMELVVDQWVGGSWRGGWERAWDRDWPGLVWPVYLA